MYAEDRGNGSGVEEGGSPDYETMTVEDLRERAAEADIDGRDEMDRKQLIWALRSD